MTIFSVLFDAITLAVCILATGCGHEVPSIPAPGADITPASDSASPAPQTVATATPTPSPTPNPTTVTYIFQNINLCTDIKTWDPNATTIKTYGNAGNGPIYYLFRYDGVWIVATGGCENGCPANVLLTRSDIHGVVCTITVVNGVLTGVTP